MRVAFGVILIFLCGCSALGPRDFFEKPRNSSRYAALYYSAPGAARVRVFAVYANFRGMMVSDYAQLAEPAYVFPGKIEVTYCCPGAEYCTYEKTDKVLIPRTGPHYLFCDAHGNLNVGELNKPAGRLSGSGTF